MRRPKSCILAAGIAACLLTMGGGARAEQFCSSCFELCELMFQRAAAQEAQSIWSDLMVERDELGRPLADYTAQRRFAERFKRWSDSYDDSQCPVPQPADLQFPPGAPVGQHEVASVDLQDPTCTVKWASGADRWMCSDLKKARAAHEAQHQRTCRQLWQQGGEAASSFQRSRSRVAMDEIQARTEEARELEKIIREKSRNCGYELSSGKLVPKSTPETRTRARQRATQTSRALSRSGGGR